MKIFCMAFLWTTTDGSVRKISQLFECHLFQNALSTLFQFSMPLLLGLLCVDFPSSPYFIEPNTTQHLQFMFSSYTFAAIWSVHVPFCFFYLCFDFSGLGMHVGRSDYFDLVCISKLSFWVIVFLICFLGTYSLFKLTNHFKVW